MRESPTPRRGTLSDSVGMLIWGEILFGVDRRFSRSELEIDW